MEDEISGEAQFSAYVYASVPLFGATLIPQLGATYDSLKSRELEISYTSPKLGLVWVPSPDTRVRVASFHLLTPRANARTGLEPTQVAGFHQLYNDQSSAKVRTRGASIDQRVSETVFTGLSAVDRNVLVHLTIAPTVIEYYDWQETETYGYLTWLPTKALSTSLGMKFGRYVRPEGFAGVEGFTLLESWELPTTVRWFGRNGLSAGVTLWRVQQRGKFSDPLGAPFTFVGASERAWLLDLSLSFRAPRHQLVFSIEGKNLADRHFRYQDLATQDALLQDRENTQIVPRRTLLARVGIRF